MSNNKQRGKVTSEWAQKLQISFLTLRFYDQQKEKNYRAFHFKSSLGYFRISFIIVSLLYSLFGYIDYIASQIDITHFFLIRYMIVVPMFVTTLILSFTKVFSRIWQPLLVVNFIVAGGGIVFMIVNAPDNLYYSGGLFLTLMAGFFFVRLRFLEATIAGAITLLLYNFALIFMGPLSFKGGYVVITNSLYFSGYIIGVIGLYQQELLQRRVFMDKDEISEAHLRIESINNNLEKTINERTRIVLKRNRELKQEILHRKQVEQQLFEAKEKAEESNLLKNKFIRSISHEVRTPMNAILGFLNIIFNKMDVESSELEEYKRLVNRNSTQLLQIIDNTLDISKIHSKSMFFSKAYVDLTEVCTHVHQEFLNEVQPKYPFELLVPAEPLAPIVTDKSRVEQLLSILLNNAFKFTQKGHVMLKLYEDRKAQENVIEVSDTGIGIDEHLQDEIFKPFDQFDDFQKGIGLGLFIARSIAENLNINIEVDSKKGKGSTFRLRFLQHNEVEVKGARVQLKEGQRGKILVTEDNADNYALIEELLRESYDIIWKRSGFDTLEFLSDNTVDLVILDILMPGIDGLETCERIRAKHPQLPIVMLSAMVQPETQDRAKKAGADVFLFKPVSIDLKNQIGKFFQSH